MMEGGRFHLVHAFTFTSYISNRFDCSASRLCFIVTVTAKDVVLKVSTRRHIDQDLYSSH